MVFAVLAALIPTAITGWIFYRQIQRSLERGVDQELSGLAMRSSRAIDRWISTRQHDTEDLAGSTEIWEILSQLEATPISQQRSTLDARIADYLESVRESTPGIIAIAVVDSTGAPVGGGQGAVLELPAFGPRDVEAGTAAIGPPRWDSIAQRGVLSIVVPLRRGSAPRSSTEAGLAVTSDFTGVLAVLDDVHGQDRANLSLITRSGMVLVDEHGNLAPPYAKRVADTVLTDVRAGASLGAYRTIDGTDVIGAFSALEELPWIVLAEIPRHEAYAEVARLRNVTLAILIGALLTVGVVAYRLAQLIVRPLDRLTRGAGEVALGDFAVELPPTGGGEVGYLTDVFNYMVVRLREGREELERLSVTDPLTGLYNRRKLAQNIEQEAQRSGRTGKPFAVLMMDIDEFKAVNDRFGHHAGDRVLVTLARTLHDSVRVIDSVGRYGGEEFVVVLPETDRTHGVETAERIRAAVASRRLAPGEGDTRVTVSIGVAEFPTDGTTVDAIIDSADRALYLAKQRGRNRVESTPTPPAGPTT
jgi:diguanylate cyclase (GGDEF)-like protein